MMKAQFEQLEMNNGESIADFNKRLVDIANESAIMEIVISD